MEFFRFVIHVYALMLVAGVRAALSADEPLDWVDPLIGTGTGHGEIGGMMPMTGVPFGSIQWVPMSRRMEVGAVSFECGGATNFLGFIGTRQPAVCMGDWGHFSFMPRVGALDCDMSSRALPSSLEQLDSRPYRTEIVAGSVRTRMSATSRAALFEISFPEGADNPHIVIDASRDYVYHWTDNSPKDGFIEFGEDCRTVTGWNSDRLDAHHSYPLPNFKGWFVMEFSRPFIACGIYEGIQKKTEDRRRYAPVRVHHGVRRIVSDVAGGYATFAPSDEPLTVRIGVSLISAEQARENMKREIPADETVEKLASRMKELWRRQMSRLTIESGDDSVKRIFYTGIYHASLYPREIGEYGRYYSAFDDKVHEGESYTCYSGWDTYRAEHPLLTLIAPERVDGMMRALIQAYEEGGWLPKWPNPGYTGIMVGGPAEVVLAEAWVKGFRGFDVKKAYEAVRKNATVPQSNDRECTWRDRGCFGGHPETRGGLSWYQELGYVPCDKVYESVSRTQDFAFDDTAAAVLAEAVGKTEDAAFFRERSHAWTNLWCRERKMCMPRNASGAWCDPKSGFAWHYTECIPETALWCVPHDIGTLIGLLGGEVPFVKRLDRYFEENFFKREGGRASIHGNEPSHHVAYLYNRAGRMDKTQERVREILSRCYSDSRRGFDGNEDCGQMSAWYVLSALGFYPVEPQSGQYEIGSPVVDGATLRLGKPYAPATLRISVRNQAPGNRYVRSVTLNGRPVDGTALNHADLVRGGELVFEMASTPSPSGADKDDEAGLQAWTYAAWLQVMRKYYSAKTGGIYVCEPKDVQPARDFPGGLLKKELRYGKGLEDCAITGGVALSGLVDAYAVTKDPLFAVDAEKVAKGLLNLVNAHPYRGFVARGLCVEDGVSICRLTSRDQVTHWVHGLWRYWRSGMMPESLRMSVRRAFADVAELMERNVTEANNWNFLQADGTMDPRGICKMRRTNPHEAARLAMIYAAAGDVTGSAHWFRLYREVRNEALEDSCRLASLSPQKIECIMPTYTFLQMNSSLELLFDLEKDEACRVKVVEAMSVCARMARKRLEGMNGRNDSLCACAEAMLAQMMVPGADSRWDASQRRILADEIGRIPAERADVFRSVHLFSAYWRDQYLQSIRAGERDDFSIADYGAKPDGTKSTEAFKAAFAAAEMSGGGRVVVPQGRWLSGAIHFRSNCELHLSEGAEIVFTQDPADYLPAVHTSWEGMECWNYSPLVYAYGCTNIAITGSGTLRGFDGDFKDTLWKKWVPQDNGVRDARLQLYRWGAESAPMAERQIWKRPNANTRPHLLQINRCRDVRLEDFKVRNSPFWTIHLYHSDKIQVRGLDVYAHGNNNDGVDIEMSRDVLVENCRFDQGGDGVVIKSGRNRDAWRLNRPTENVVVRNCEIVNAHTVLGVGSEISGGVRNILMENCKAGDVYRVYYVKTNRRRGGFVENVVMRNVKAKSARSAVVAIETDVLYKWAKFPDCERRLTRISNLSVDSVSCEKAKRAIFLKGDPEMPVKGVRVTWLDVGEVEKHGNVVENVEGFVETKHSPPNYDTSKIPPYTLEDPLIFLDGTKVSGPDDWPRRRREILDVFAREMYGAEPPPPETVKTDLLEEKIAAGGFAVRRRYRMAFRADGSGPTIEWIVWTPRHAKKPSPVILKLNYRGNQEFDMDASVPLMTEWSRSNQYTDGHQVKESTRGFRLDQNGDSVFPLQMLLARGYAVMTASYCDVSPDPEPNESEPQFSQMAFAYTGVFELWGPRDYGRTDNITSLGAWAWALSRGLDLAERVPGIDAKRNVVTGYSRLAKAALLATVRDERFKVCVPVQTGGGGCPLAKRNYGECPSTECRSFTHWYCGAYAKYSAEPWKSLTFDQHLLLASVAPRALLVCGFISSKWCDTEGEFLAAKAASPAWEMHGCKGLPDVSWPDNYDTSAFGDKLGYVRRDEGHGISGYDWMWLLDFADKNLK